MAEVHMPKMGDGMEEGKILRWLKKEGDLVAIEEPIAEIETDKASVEIPAEDAGVLSRILVKEGETVPVGELIALIGDTKVSASATSNPPNTYSELVIDRTATGEAGTAPENAEAEAPGGPFPLEIPSESDHERIKSSPLARKMAETLGINLAMVTGTGPNGRILERDINAFTSRTSTSQRSKQAATPAPPVRPTLPAPEATGVDMDISKMRKAIARRTVASKQQVPHFYLTMPINMDSAVALLHELNTQSPSTKITINDLIIKAVAMTLEKMPDVNVSYTPDDKIRHYDQINIGIAVGSEEGLTIPVIQDCGSKNLRQISKEAKELIAKARTGALSLQEMSGGTFSISNLGMYGIEEFAAIINPPESAILAVGAVVPEVTVDESGAFVVRKMMRVTLSCDHRAVDGLLGAQFLHALRETLEKPYNLLT
jgi:pyruvate dehydrogenase E2 component (dihydrolipoamide acetyltransferase)